MVISIASIVFSKKHKKVCKNGDFFSVAMHSENTKAFEFDQYQKSHFLFIKILNLCQKKVRI